jgi:transposase-like protein
MEEGRQKPKRLSHKAKFKREIIQCAEENGNRKAAEIFGVDESKV